MKLSIDFSNLVISDVDAVPISTTISNIIANQKTVKTYNKYHQFKCEYHESRAWKTEKLD